MKRKNIKGIYSKPMDARAAAIADNNNLPVMPDVKQNIAGVLRNPPKGRGFMPISKTAVQAITKAAVSSQQQMAPFSLKEANKISTAVTAAEFYPQVEKKCTQKNGRQRVSCNAHACAEW